MWKNNEVDLKQKGLENFILLVLGMSDRRLSLLHLEKEVFLLWNFHKKIKPYLKFIKHYRGPFSKEIQETVLNPMYLEGYWNYISSRDRISGGYVQLTPKGRQEYERLVEKLQNNDEMLHLLAGIKMVRELYDKLSLEELLLLIYDTYPEYTERSEVWKDIKKKKSQLAISLKRKGVASDERYLSLVH
ncbi:MAG: hypothetical protein DRO67_09290 [Candidatus Asgardarchaeum californiense]|nr:MAG: hypothetical protein DRO67_09290 [Candidatus Asgardarchaeum californiense]